MAKKEMLKSFDFLYIMGLKFSDEDLVNRKWYRLDSKGNEVLEVNGKPLVVKEGKNHYNISHNYIKFWLLHYYLYRASSYEFITLFYFWAKRVEKNLKPAIMIKQICGLLPNEIVKLL